MNLESSVLFEGLGDGLNTDFELRPELFFMVQRRSHVRDGSGETVADGVYI